VFRSVGLVARYDKRKAITLAGTLTKHLKASGVEVYLEDTLAGKVGIKEKTLPLEGMKTDFIITIGGDGTILRTGVAIPKPEPPILAVNMGIRGFLTEVEPEQAIDAVNRILKGDYTLQKCMKLKVEADGTSLPDALNEVVATADEPAKLLYAKIHAHGEHILDCQADGMMVATQTGSTGYSLSAGGPVLAPGANAFVLTPICPLNMFHPVVFPSDTVLTLQITKPQRILVLIDGKYRKITQSKQPTITVARSKNVTSFIRFRQDFYHRLKSRLLFKGTE